MSRRKKYTKKGQFCPFIELGQWVHVWLLGLQTNFFCQFERLCQNICRGIQFRRCAIVQQILFKSSRIRGAQKSLQWAVFSVYTTLSWEAVFTVFWIFIGIPLRFRGSREIWIMRWDGGGGGGRKKQIGPQLLFYFSY